MPGPFRTLIDALAQGGRGVIMTMGKGGVGKTTVAAAIAVELAARGFPVMLSTTDPAAHVAHAVGATLPNLANLSLSRIDPEAEVAQYRQEVLAKASPKLDPNARAMLEEDLRSPCTEEIAVFRAFARAVDGGKDGFVVLDTAPTGHTILLLDAAEAYHREVSRTQGEMPEAVTHLLPRLRDPAFTRVLVVTLPEATPVSEAERLQQDLIRAGIEPFAWVVNQSLLVSGTQHPLLAQRGQYEQPYIRRVGDRLARRCAIVPWLPEVPAGVAGLRQLVGQAMPQTSSFHCHTKAWRQHHAEIRAFLKNRAGSADEADDLLQEVFLKALHQGKEFCSIENARAWLFQVARNLLVDRLRLAKDQVPLPDDLLAEAPPETDPVDLLSHCLPRVLSELSPEDSEAIVLCDIEGMTQKAFAERLGLSLPAAKSRVQRARLRLRTQLAEACQLSFDGQGKVCCFVPRPPLESAKPS